MTSIVRLIGNVVGVIAVVTLVIVVVMIVVTAMLNSPFFTRGRGARWLAGRRHRHEQRRMQDPLYALLRREVTRVGAEYERIPYERLRDLDEVLACRAEVVDGTQVYFNAEVVTVLTNGDLRVCIDAGADGTGRKIWKSWPSYEFHKRPDETVHY